MIKQRVLIVGYGEMGHAMQHLLQRSHVINVWHCDTADGMAVPLTQAATDKDFIILCIPTGPLHDVVAELKPSLHEGTLVISISKGLDDKGRIAIDAVSESLEPTTATSVDSHHHALGMQLARGERDNLAGEGTHSIRLIGKLNLIDTRHYPLMRLIQEIVLTNSDVRKKWQYYLDGTFRT